MGTMRILDHTGDTAIAWSVDDPESVAHAARVIDRLTRECKIPFARVAGAPTPSGPVRLGRLYALVHRPDDEPDLERVLCVVPHALRELPLADIWANLLLTLAVEPSEFFRGRTPATGAPSTVP